MPDVNFFQSNPALPPDLQTQQRQQQMQQYLAMALAQKAQQPDESMQGWNQMKLVPRMNPLQPLSKAFEAALTGKALQKAVGGASDLQQAMYGYGQNELSQGMGGANQQSAQGAALQGDQSTAPQPPQDPMKAFAQKVIHINNAVKIGAIDKDIAKEYLASQAPSQDVKDAVTAGQDPAKVVADKIRKANLIAPVEVRKENLSIDPVTKQPIAYNPAVPEGSMPKFGPNGMPTSVEQIPGAAPAAAGAAAARAAGAQSQTPIKLGVDANGKDVYGFPNPPALGGDKSYFGGQNTASPAELQGQKTGAQQGQDYSKGLAANASNATEVRRSLAELTQLAKQANPSVSNPAKLQLGSWFMAAGLSPQTTAGILGVDVNALAAAHKQTGSLAVAKIHEMTSRGTNFDLQTFIGQNPNLAMPGIGSFTRVAQYMDNQAKQTIAKQKDFMDWKKGVSPDDWEGGHTAHWLEQQNAMIDAGGPDIKKVSSPEEARSLPPGTKFQTPDGRTMVR